MSDETEQPWLLCLVTPEYVLLATPLVGLPEDDDDRSGFKVARSFGPRWHGPVGRAIMRRRYAAMRATFAEDGPDWPCGKQDRYAAALDQVLDDIRATGYTGRLP